MPDTIKTILIDDNKLHLSSLLILLQRNCPKVEICDTCRSAEEGLESIKMHKPDLVFLDIQMETPVAGFELLEQLPERAFDVIFTTQHDMHAMRAFEVYPIDFLVKPIDPRRLVKAMSIIEERQLPLVSNALLSEIKTVYQNPEVPSPQVSVPTMEGCSFVKAADIIRCQAATEKGNQTLFYLKTQKNPILCSKTLKTVEQELLKGHAFCRIHQSHLVNRLHLKNYIKDGGSPPEPAGKDKKAAGGWVVTIDQAVLPVSKAGKQRLLS
ncbi:LytR/AlgR family response regulator transcription factor [Phaeodactylibacter xiamenensis]|uniref:LytR/AlgR family response regulator transcription factor n=1 Tax=Phaeodactylibacter xiamenensis TaxID=1524460 RepID=UPI0024A91D9B|nr:response regulator transcription factor [Phaeodactylibacter xiamenensis]